MTRNAMAVLLWTTWALASVGCNALSHGGGAVSFKDDLVFLKQHTDVVVLSDAAGAAKVAVVPMYQGRVMTSTAGGEHALSFGWINRDVIASGKRQLHMNVFGGEDRFWLGPEGGQFSIYFAKDAPFNLGHWQVPEPIDWGAWRMIDHTGAQANFVKSMQLTNYSGTAFHLTAERSVRLLGPAEVAQALGAKPGRGVRAVAFESDNRITNTGDKAWDKSTGLLSIWILGMFNPSAHTTIVVPFKPGPVETLGPIVNDAYFGKVPDERLVVKQDEGVLFFSGDGQYRSKIGVSPKRASNTLGSYDATHHVLTLVQFTLPAGATDYVNSMWEIQEHPFGGDAVNSYNDGPAAPGAKPLGPFYEMESSSPAAALRPGQTLRHVHRTFHLTGDVAELDRIARATLGVSLEQITAALQ